MSDPKSVPEDTMTSPAESLLLNIFGVGKLVLFCCCDTDYFLGCNMPRFDYSFCTTVLQMCFTHRYLAVLLFHVQLL